MSNNTDELIQQVVEAAKAKGRVEEDRRISEFLIEKRAIRSSMLGQGWLVLYTEDGPIDVKIETLFEALESN